jgi:NADH-quinone oxidoreductase subunit B
MVTEKTETPKIKRKRGMSVAIFPLNLGGSNGAKIELDAIFVPPYNAGKYGITLTHSPKQADIIFLYGNGTQKTLKQALALIDSLPDEIKLVALGSDAPTTANAHEKGYTVRRIGESEALPEGKKIAAYLSGSPPEPQSIINLILELA